MKIDVSGRIVIPMSIGDKSFNMLIDTGGFASMLTRSTVTTLNLTPQQATIAEMGFGGFYYDKYVEAKDIALGDLKAPSLKFLVHEDFADMGGILAPDILRGYDLDFDFANSSFSLFHPGDCQGRHVWWTKEPYAVIEFNLDKDGHIVLPVQLDGKEITAIVDTGAATSVLELETAERLLDFDDKNPKLEKTPANTHTDTSTDIRSSSFRLAEWS